jgi:glucosylglycerate synthase
VQRASQTPVAMASPSSIDGLGVPQEVAATERAVHAGGSPRLILCVPSLPEEVLPGLLADLATVFGRDEVLIASPDLEEPEASSVLPLTVFDGTRVRSDWVLTAGDYAAANELAQRHDAAQVILLGADVCALPATAIREMADRIAGGADLIVPAYSLGAHDGLVTSAFLYPLTRALFAANIRFPLPMDAAMSRRMVERMASVAQRQTASQPDALLWPVAEAAAAAFTVYQVDSDAPTPIPPAAADFNTLFVSVAGGIFADIEAKASFWQRSRGPAVAMREIPPAQRTESGDLAEEVPGMVEAFRLAHRNLQEIWALALPPQSLLALKKLSIAEPAAFTIAPALWARLVYDFALAFHLRSLNRGHLLGAFTPVYLAWVASALRTVTDDASAAVHREETAAAFEREKPYLVARWRWPDRFNP